MSIRLFFLNYQSSGLFAWDSWHTNSRMEGKKMAKNNTLFKRKLGQFLADSRGTLLPADFADQSIRDLVTAIMCLDQECAAELVTIADDAAAAFSQFSMVSLPDNKTKSQWALYHKTWRQPLEQIISECGEDVDWREIIERAVGNMSESGMTIYSPLSILKVAVSLVGGAKRTAAGRDKKNKVLELTDL